jgi:hypothetical protein
MEALLSFLILGCGLGVVLTFHYIGISKTRSKLKNAIPYPLALVAILAGTVKHNEWNLLPYAVTGVLAMMIVAHMAIIKFR